MSKDLKKIDYLILGSGISGLCCALELTERFQGLEQMPEIEIISSSQLIPCSLRTTSSVALQGIKKGLSPLGDLLYDSFKTFVQKNDFYQFKSIEKVDRFHFAYDENSKEKLAKRFDKIDSFTLEEKSYEGIIEDGYVISPELFYQELIDLLKSRSVKFINDLILYIDRDKKEIGSKSYNYSYDKLILSTGVYSGLFPILSSNNEELRKLKGIEVPGHYYEWEFDYPHSFILTIDGHNLCYRKLDKKLVLGGSTEKDKISLIREDQLQSMYEKLKDIIELPDISKARVLSGLRQKGVKRTPYIDQIEDGIFAMTSLYKNGFSASFEGARILADKLLS